MYASDILSLTELKEKITGITEELNALDRALARLAPGKKAEEAVQRYAGEIQRFLELETVTNMDMRRILDHISVDREGHVRVVLRKFDDAPA